MKRPFVRFLSERNEKVKLEAFPSGLQAAPSNTGIGIDLEAFCKTGPHFNHIFDGFPGCYPLIGHGRSRFGHMDNASIGSDEEDVQGNRCAFHPEIPRSYTFKNEQHPLGIRQPLPSHEPFHLRLGCLCDFNENGCGNRTVGLHEVEASIDANGIEGRHASKVMVVATGEDEPYGQEENGQERPAN
jgi:hypothetical protein